MLGKAIHIELPRRVVVHYLLYGLASIAWIGVAAMFMFHLIVVISHENDVLKRLDRLAKSAKVEFLRDGGSNLQSLVERFQDEHQLLTCAIVGRDQRFLAHSDKRTVGTDHPAPLGKMLTLPKPDVIGVRYSLANRTVRQYEVPLEVGDKFFGNLSITAEEPTFGRSVSMASSYAMYGLGVPLFWLGIGGFLIQRMIRPTEGIESQLRRAATAPTLQEVKFESLRGMTASTIGWNRVVDALQNGLGKTPALDKRLTDAIQSRRQERSDDILNSLSDGIAVANHEGGVTFFNQAFGALFAGQFEPKDIPGKTLEDCLSLTGVSASDNPLLNPEFRNRIVVVEIKRGKEGENTWRVARHPIRSSERGSSSVNGGHVWCVRDITQQKLAEAMRDQFLDSATHELRTPLANIKAYAETLALTEELDVENQKQFCNIINSEATRLARFIDDLLSISSMEVGSLTLNRQEVDVERLLREAILKTRPQMDSKRLEFETLLPEKFPKLRFDKDKILVALVNLLGNAAKYTPDGGRVALKAKSIDGQFRIDIEDTGVGISQDDLHRIWDKFFRSDNEYVQKQTGTGLGLSLTREVIRLHGGDLTVKSEIGKGSTFTVTLPLE